MVAKLSADIESVMKLPFFWLLLNIFMVMLDEACSFKRVFFPRYEVSVGEFAKVKVLVIVKDF